jgi:hypothetical protein
MNRTLITLLLFLPIFSFGQVNLKNGLVACYPFNANANDVSGNGNNGTVNGATLTTDRFGNTNNAYSFNGISDFIEISPSKLQTTEFSYSLWVKPSSIPAEGIAYFLFSVGSESGDQDLTLNKSYANANDGFTGGGYLDVGETVFCQKGTSPNVNQWYHLVFVRETNVYKVYLDGNLMCTTSTVTKPPFYGTGIVAATIGGRRDKSQFAHCSLDDIHLYNRAINADEVKALYELNTPQTITISTNNTSPCGGDQIILTANGTTNTSSYQWKVDGINNGTNNKTFGYTTTRKTEDYTVKITVEVSDEDICFSYKSTIVDLNVTVKGCTPTGVNLKNGLVACYPFNSNAIDATGNKNDGIISGASLTNDRFGNVNSAYYFDGSAVIAVGKEQFSNQSYTYSTWVKLDSLPELSYQYGLISIYGNGPDQVLSVANSYQVSYQAPFSTGFLINGYNYGTPRQSNNWTGVTPNTNQWYHVVCTRDDTSIKLYVDGQLVSPNNSAVISTGGSVTDYGYNGVVIFGAGGGGQYLIGSLDDIYIYNRAITAEEVTALYQNSKSIPCEDGVIACHPFSVVKTK